MLHINIKDPKKLIYIYPNFEWRTKENITRKHTFLILLPLSETTWLEFVDMVSSISIPFQWRMDGVLLTSLSTTPETSRCTLTGLQCYHSKRLIYWRLWTKPLIPNWLLSMVALHGIDLLLMGIVINGCTSRDRPLTNGNCRRHPQL